VTISVTANIARSPEEAERQARGETIVPDGNEPDAQTYEVFEAQPGDAE
jgi:hypothetical protein